MKKVTRKRNDHRDAASPGNDSQNQKAMYLPALTGFFAASGQDERISPLHICVYMALFEYWNQNNFQNPVSVTRQRVMQAAKIRRTTYHKCMKELHEYGYIQYVPSYHPVLGSLVWFTIFSPEIAQSCDTSCLAREENISSLK